MALTTDDIRSAAERLDHAEKTRTQIRQLSLQHPEITIEDAYAIQKAWVEMKVQPAVPTSSAPARMTDAAARARGVRVITTTAYRRPRASAELGHPNPESPVIN